jgi:pimeloyl-ACP methyl ester carboxylesterase
MHGNEACAANSMSCAEPADLCGEESGWQERGASGPGPLALGQHQRCRRVPGRAGPQAPAGVVLHRAANRPARRTPWTQRHLRVITTERPGFGASTRLPGRGFAAPADDLAAVLDHLGLEAVHVMGGSGAAPHQLAFAARRPDRVRAMTVLVGAAPCTDDEAGQMIGLNADAHRLVHKGDVEGYAGCWSPSGPPCSTTRLGYFGPRWIGLRPPTGP